MGNTNATPAIEGSKSGISSLIESRAKQLYIEENEMNEYLRIASYSQKRITKITSALLNEHLERPESLENALNVWN